MYIANFTVFLRFLNFSKTILFCSAALGVLNKFKYEILYKASFSEFNVFIYKGKFIYFKNLMLISKLKCAP